MKNPHASAISSGIRQLMLVRRMAIVLDGTSEEKVNAFINAEGEKWMRKTEDMNVFECMFELAKLQNELDESVKQLNELK